MLYKSLTWDQGKEMAGHKRIMLATDIQVYCCDPRSPWQRGSNENKNGLLRQYLPQGIDISSSSQAKLNAVARQLNERPRKTLGFQTPAEMFSRRLHRDFAGAGARLWLVSRDHFVVTEGTAAPRTIRRFVGIASLRSTPLASAWAGSHHGIERTEGFRGRTYGSGHVGHRRREPRGRHTGLTKTLRAPAGQTKGRVAQRGGVRAPADDGRGRTTVRSG